MFGALVDITGVRSSCFMLLYGSVCVSLVWMHFQFRNEALISAKAALPA
jgi:NNP family nitrate/nitrite transporter-like MFS transporter